MSSILKALSKIGEEKRADQHAAPDLRLDHGLTPVQTKPFLPLLVGTAFGAVVAGLLFLLLFNDREPVTKAQPAVKAQPKIIVQPLVKKDFPEPVKVVPVVTLLPVPLATPDPFITPQSVTTPEQEKKVTSKPATIIPVKEQTVIETPLIVAKSSATMQKPAEVTVIKAIPSVSPELPEGIYLVVTEIFYNEDSANSMAVINELPVMIGTHVNSAVVSEIRSDSVLFVIDGNPYVVDVANP